NILNKMRPQIQNGVPLVVLEPSCCAVFRDEMIDLLPHDEDAKRLHQQTFLFSEFLDKKAPHFQIPKLRQKAIVHGHCHQKALMGLDSDIAILKKLGLDFQVLDSGCCGMAGAFGFEKGEHYQISIQCGERFLLPEV